MRIAYITSGFPETFVINEIEAHRQAGWEILPLVSAKPFDHAGRSALDQQWHGRACYRPSPLAQFLGILRELVTHPIRFVRVLAFLAHLACCNAREFAKAIHEFTVAFYFADKARQFGAQHVHAHFAARSLSLALMVAILVGRPVSCTAHAFDIFTRPASSLRPRLLRCRFIAAISQYNVRHLRGLCGDSVADLCHVIHCGINMDLFQVVQRRPQPGRMIAVAHLTNPKKGFDVAIDACARLRDQGVDFLFQIVGDGPLRPRIEEQVRRLKLEDRVQLLGGKPNDQIRDLLSQACVFVLACVTGPDGDRDGIPVAMMEALACEVPALTTNISGNPELVIDGVTGRLVPEKDPQALAEAMKDMLCDMGRLEQYGQAGRALVAREFNTAINSAKLRTLMEQASSPTTKT